MKKIFWWIGGLIICIVALLMGCFHYFVQQPNTSVMDSGIIIIHPKDSFDVILNVLQEKKYIQNSYTFRKVAELKKYPQLIKPGRYKIRDGMTNNELVNMLRSGQQEAIHFTFNNIRTMEEFAQTVNKQLAIDPMEFLSLANDSKYLKKLGFTPENFIGIFLPNTYQIFWQPKVEDFIKRMHAEYLKFWNEERIKKANQIHLSPMDVIILASIVEEETNITEEYPIIAGVYINRLKKGWNLEACPTLKYAWGDFTLKRILTKHTQIDSPYNTYKNAGLPPGPIRMPSLKVIDAVLNYTPHNYMFFCAKSDFSGKHCFSRTLREHNRYANLYHQALNRYK